MSAADRAARERAAQGLPPTITDAAALARIAVLLRKTAQYVSERAAA